MTSAAEDSDQETVTAQDLWQALKAAVTQAHSRSSANISRSEYAAALLAALAEASIPGARLGTKFELRGLCEVSVGTFNEAVKLAQSRGFINSRPGPGGGIFAAEQSAFVRLGNSVLALDGSATSVADAVRMRDALDPLLVEDALWHSSATDLTAMRRCLADMREAVETDDTIAFIHSNWALHARIAAVSPSAILRSVYVSLLELVETHTLAVRAADREPLPAYIRARYDLHERIVDSIERRDRDSALMLIEEHRMTSPSVD